MSKRRRGGAHELSALADHQTLDAATGEWEAFDARELPSTAHARHAESESVAAARSHEQEAGQRQAPQPDAGDSDGCSTCSDDSSDSSDDDSWYPSRQSAQSCMGNISDQQLLAASADQRQGVWIVRYRLQGQRKWRIAFLGLRYVQFSDGMQLVGFSKGCPCPDSDASATLAQLDRQDRPGHARGWPPEPAMCSCCCQLLDSLGGEVEMQRLLRMADADSGSDIMQQVALGGVQYTAVRRGDSFSQWGAVDKHGRCCTCTSRHWICEHAQQLPAQERSPTMNPADFERKLHAQSDVESGRRRSKFITSQPLPVRLSDDAELCQCITERRAGHRPLPATIEPPAAAVQHQRCDCCQQINWRTDAAGRLHHSSVVFLQAAVMNVVFIALMCGTPNCKGILQVDGKEHGLLRKTKHLAFGLCLLYSWLKLMAAGGVKWWTFWRNTLFSYEDSTPVDVLRRWMRSCRRPFQAAMLDFVDLMGIDWRAAFTCCNGAPEATADGIQIGHKLGQSCIQRPYEAPADAPLTAGVQLHNRVLVQEVDMRRGLRQLTDSKAGGIPMASFAQLRQQVADLAADQPEASLLPFLSETVAGADEEHVLAAPQYRPLLRSLSTTAPALQLLPLALWGAARQLLATRRLSFEAESSIRRYSPLLHDFLRPHLKAPECDNSVITFVRRLLQVARSCTRPDTLVDCRSTGRRRGGDQPRPQPQHAALAATARAPTSWTEEESFRRTGVWCGMPAGTTWQPSQLGGSHVHRQLRAYAADAYKMAKDGSTSTCNKYQVSALKLIAGYMIFWCTCCRKCILFSIMSDAESPRTPFDLLYTHMERPPQQFQLDNGCNLHNFALAREPQYFAGMRVLVDEPHYRGHTNCSTNYNTGLYPMVSNSPLAEQKNSVLRQLEGQLAYMDQLTSLQYMRIVLFLMNMEQEKRLAGECFYD